MVPYRQVGPGGRARAAELARLQQEAAAATNATGGFQDVSSFGVHQIQEPPRWIWASLGRRIASNLGTENGWPECSWWEYSELKFDHCDGRVIEGVSHETSEPPPKFTPDWPAYCTNPDCDYPPGTIVQLWKGTGRWWFFNPPHLCPGSGASGFSGHSGESGESGSGRSGHLEAYGNLVTPPCLPDCRLPDPMCLSLHCPLTGATCVVIMRHVGSGVFHSDPATTDCTPSLGGGLGLGMPVSATLTPCPVCTLDLTTGLPVVDGMTLAIAWGLGIAGNQCQVTFCLPCTSPLFFQRHIDYPSSLSGQLSPCNCGPFGQLFYPWDFILSACG